MIRTISILAISIALAAAAPAQTIPAGAKTEVVHGVEARSKQAQVIGDQLFSFAELGFQEVETTHYLTALLET